MAASIIKKVLPKTTWKTYNVYFTSNAYVSPYSATYSGKPIPTADIEAYGIPVYGAVLIAGIAASPCYVDENGNVEGLSYSAGNRDISIMFMR